MATIQMSYYSICLDRIVPVTAVIPLEPSPGGKTRNGTFPSLYLLHGYSGFCTDWLYGTRVAELAARYGVEVFCPSGENAFYLNDEGTNDRYADQIGQELVEVTRALFPISAKKEDTILAGLSMGGYGALRNGLWYDDNLMDNHPGKEGPVFQIDGNLGAAAAMADCLAQNGPAGLRLLPALPPGWCRGSAHGLCLTGGLRADLRWQQGKLEEARLFASRPWTGTLRCGEVQTRLTLCAGQTVRLDSLLKQQIV